MTKITGKNHDNAVLLLDAAAELGLESGVVRATSDGFDVPDEVAVKAGLAKDDTPKETSTKRAPAKKAATKKAASQKAAPATDDKKE